MLPSSHHHHPRHHSRHSVRLAANNNVSSSSPLLRWHHLPGAAAQHGWTAGSAAGCMGSQQVAPVGGRQAGSLPHTPRQLEDGRRLGLVRGARGASGAVRTEH